MKVRVTPSYRRPAGMPHAVPLDLAPRRPSLDSYLDMVKDRMQPVYMRVWDRMRNNQDLTDDLSGVSIGDIVNEIVRSGLIGDNISSDMGLSDISDGNSDSGCSSGVEQTRIKTEMVDSDDSGRCEDDDDSDVASPGGSRATYMSANCVVFTHYTGDVASVVDQHFSRALSYSQDKASPGSDKECSPMSTRNFPPSFWNQESVSVSHGHEGLYGESMYHGATAHTPADPWHSHYQQYTAAAHHHRAVHDYHHHHHQHMAGYGGLLLPPSSRLPPHAQYPKTMDWNHRLHHDQSAHHLDPATSYASYPSMAGLDASSVQDPSKSDLYWF